MALSEAEKCRKCGIDHPPEWEHEYNLQYQYWLNRELEKVDKVVASNRRLELG